MSMTVQRVIGARLGKLRLCILAIVAGGTVLVQRCQRMNWICGAVNGGTVRKEVISESVGERVRFW